MSVWRAAPLFTATVTLIDASPRPFEGDTVAHGCSLAAVHEQALCVRTSAVASPPLVSTAASGPVTL